MNSAVHNEEVYSKEERVEILKKMQKTSDTFYRMAIHTNCHPFIEFCGLMNEYIKICESAHKEGIDFTNTSIHTRGALPLTPPQARYIGEKFGCIFANSLTQDPECLETFLQELGISVPQQPEEEALHRSA